MKMKVIKFWAPWCAPCKKLAPVLDSVLDSRYDVDLEEVNVDEEPERFQSYGFSSIPLIVVEKDGKVEATIMGVKPAKEITKVLNEVASR